MSHDAIIRALRAIVASTSLADAADAFLAGLTSAAPRFRTVLGHYAFAANLPDHRFRASDGESSYLCCVCGLSETEELERDEHAAFRAKGDYRLADPVGAMLDLQDFARAPRPTPTADDLACFARMLAAIKTAPRASALLQTWKFVPRTNKYSRENLVATLGACGLLETIDHPSHLTRWVGFWEYQETPGTAGDMHPPEAWWMRADGVTRAALDLVFPHRALPRTTFALRRWKRAPARGTSKVGRVELDVRDRIGIRYLDRHFVGSVIGAHPGKSALPIIEFYGATWKRWPTAALLAKTPARVVGPHRVAPLFRREPLAFDGLALYGKVMREAHFEVLGRDLDPPRATGPLPPYGYRVVAPQNLLFILDTLAVN